MGVLMGVGHVTHGEGIEMKLLASLIILLTCQALDSTGERSPDPKDVNVYVFIPKPSEGDSSQGPNVESEKANSDKKAGVESEKDKIEKPVAEKKKGNDYAANFEDDGGNPWIPDIWETPDIVG